MEEFIRMIYRQWADKHEERDLFFGKGEELSNELQKTLSLELNNEIYETFCDSCQEVEERAFIEGFSYACKCISLGKVELGGAK